MARIAGNVVENLKIIVTHIEEKGRYSRSSGFHLVFCLCLNAHVTFVCVGGVGVCVCVFFFFFF